MNKDMIKEIKAVIATISDADEKVFQEMILREIVRKQHEFELMQRNGYKSFVPRLIRDKSSRDLLCKQKGKRVTFGQDDIRLFYKEPIYNSA
jgi:hypothetical protein